MKYQNAQSTEKYTHPTKKLCLPTAVSNNLQLWLQKELKWKHGVRCQPAQAYER